MTVNNLSKSYGDNQILKQLSFEVYKGEILGILGTNGAGKTTLLECLEGLRKYDSGEITITGKIGIQLQNAMLPAYIKVIEAINLYASWNNCQVSNELIKKLKVDQLAKKQYQQLSTGQKMRLHLLLSLINDPDILFLDEPTAGVDVEGKLSLHQLILDLYAQGKTIILSSHDMNEIEKLCHRVIILNHGQIAFIGSLNELRHQADCNYRINLVTKNQKIIKKAQNITELITILSKYQADIDDLSINRDTLQDYFLDLVRGEK